MIGYAAIRWRPADPAADRQAAQVRAHLSGLGWSFAIDLPGWCVAQDGQTPDRLVQRFDEPHGVIIGPLYDRAATDAGRCARHAPPPMKADFHAYAASLATTAWGRYVAIHSDPDDPDRLQIFRDPIGALECVTWTRDGVRIVTSRPEILLSVAGPAGLAIDWPRVGELLHSPAAVGEALPFTEVAAIPAGTLVSFERDRRDEARLWEPRSFCTASPSPPSSRTRALHECVDACVAACCLNAGIGVAELSGGLDSAIVAAAVSASTSAPVHAWFNYHSDQCPGDERRFAHALADHLGLPLTTVLRDARQLDAADLATMPIAVRPGLGSVSLFHDAHLACQADAIGATSILTGQGGDAIFFQPRTALVAADLWSDPRPFREKLRTGVEIAAWSGTTVWTVLAAALRHRFHPRAIAFPGNPPEFLGKHIDRRPYRSRWLESAGHLPPAKQLQIGMLANSRSAFGTSWCSRGRDVIHPLMSQPLIEHVLAIPVLDLTYGRRDRALARDAFTDRLPRLLIDRRDKGDLTPYFGRMLAASTAFLRPFLLDGTLARHGVIDRATLEPMLTPDHLMQHDRYSALITTVLLEHWARHWEDRLATSGARHPAPRS